MTAPSPYGMLADSSVPTPTGEVVRQFSFPPDTHFNGADLENQMSLLNEAAVIALTGIPRSTMHRHISAGNFPAPTKPDGWHILWRFSEVEDWLLARAVVQDVADMSAIPVLDLVALARSIDPSLACRFFPRTADVLRRAA